LDFLLPFAIKSAAREDYCKYVGYLHVDRTWYNELTRMKELVISGEILSEGEKLAGKLG
jgi:hypothetical protein